MEFQGVLPYLRVFLVRSRSYSVIMGGSHPGDSEIMCSTPLRSARREAELFEVHFVYFQSSGSRRLKINEVGSEISRSVGLGVGLAVGIGVGDGGVCKGGADDGGSKSAGDLQTKGGTSAANVELGCWARLGQPTLGYAGLR